MAKHSELGNSDLSYYFHSQEEIHPDVFELFTFYNSFFFHGRLDKCVVKWSKRMTSCAGTCKYEGMQSSTITLSEALLQYRSSDEIKETLLHEMIHAYLFIVDPQSCKYEGGHGQPFTKLMKEINAVAGLKITVYHSFHREVQIHQKHVWRCTGRCKEQPPYFGYVRRAMNRQPQRADPWFGKHEKECGGKFLKIMEPEQVNKKESKKESKNPKKSKEVKKEDLKSYGGMTIEDYVKMYEDQDKKQSQNNQKKPTPKPPNEITKQVRKESKPTTTVTIPDRPHQPEKRPEDIVDYQLLALLDFLDSDD